MPSYQTLAAPSQYHYEEKRSVFLAFIFPTTSRDMALSHLNALRAQYPDARHYCWAYLIGDPEQPTTAAFNDDGEPSGTAGKPILHVLTQRGAGDCCAVVVRYFGGIKLGAGGLVRAYGQAVSKALDCAQWACVVPTCEVAVTTPYEDEPHIRHLVALYNGKVIDQQYTEAVTVYAEIAHSDAQRFIEDTAQKSAGRAAAKIC
ncbi:MAG TPA: YigZ family protein [Marinagarivorans sp.]